MVSQRLTQALVKPIFKRMLLYLVDDSDIVCQPAARWMDINELLKEKGALCLPRSQRKLV